MANCRSNTFWTALLQIVFSIMTILGSIFIIPSICEMIINIFPEGLPSMLDSFLGWILIITPIYSVMLFIWVMISLYKKLFSILGFGEKRMKMNF